MKIQRDPTKSKRHIRSYEKALKQLIESYRHFAQRALLASAGRRLSTEKELAVDINTDLLRRALEEAALYAVLEPGQQVILTAMRASYQQGITYSTTQLARNGVDVSVQTGFLPTDWRMLDALRVRNLTVLKGITEEMNKRIILEITDATVKGETIEQIAKRLNAAVDIGKNRSMVMARTEVMYATNQATLTRYYQQGVDRVVWIGGADDDRICDECLTLHGRVFDIDDVPDIPVHPNCRCTVAPAKRGD